MEDRLETLRAENEKAKQAISVLTNREHVFAYAFLRTSTQAVDELLEALRARTKERDDASELSARLTTALNASRALLPTQDERGALRLAVAVYATGGGDSDVAADANRAVRRLIEAAAGGESGM